MSAAFAFQLAQLRRAAGVSQRKAAADLQVSQALLSHYEKGIREPGLDFVVRAAELTETEVEVEAAAADSAAENDGTETPAEEGSIADETFAQLNAETSAEADAEAKDQSSDDNA